MNIGKRLATKRNEAGINQTALANYIGVSRATISQWEGEHTEPDGKNLLLCSLKLNVDPFTLQFGEADERTKKAYQQGLVSSGGKIPLVRLENSTTVDEITLNFPKHYYAIKIEDSDMINRTQPSPTFPPGTIVIVNPGADYKINDFVIAQHKEKGTVIFRKVEKYGLDVMLVPLNALAKIYDIKDFYIQGNVVASLFLEFNK